MGRSLARICKRKSRMNAKWMWNHCHQRYTRTTFTNSHATNNNTIYHLCTIISGTREYTYTIHFVAIYQQYTFWHTIQFLCVQIARQECMYTVYTVYTKGFLWLPQLPVTVLVFASRIRMKHWNDKRLDVSECFCRFTLTASKYAPHE